MTVTFRVSGPAQRAIVEWLIITPTQKWNQRAVAHTCASDYVGLVARVWNSYGEELCSVFNGRIARGAIPGREGSGAISRAALFFRYFQILRVHCDLIRLLRHGRDGWSDTDFFRISHESTPRWEQSRYEREPQRKTSHLAAVIYLKLTPNWLRDTLYLPTRGTFREISRRASNVLFFYQFRSNPFFRLCRTYNASAMRYLYV